MPFLDTDSLPVIERLPGWHGRYFHSQSMTFAHYNFTRGSSIHEHFHPEEEVYEVIEGELEVTIDGVVQIARAGLVAIVPANVRRETPEYSASLPAARPLSLEQIAWMSWRQGLWQKQAIAWVYRNVE